MSVEAWAPPERTLKYAVTVSPEDHVVTVRGAAYFVSLVTVRFRRTGPEWSAPRVSVVGADRRGKHADTVWTLNQLDTVPAWLDRIITAATPIDPC